MNPLAKRVVSGAIAGLLTLGTFLLYSNKGLIYLGVCFAAIGCAEFSSLIFRGEKKTLPLQIVFVIFSVTMLAITSLVEEPSLLIYSALLVIFLAGGVFLNRSEDIHNSARILSSGCLGLVYCGVFPGLTLKTLSLPKGGAWFLLILLVVFFGDTAAYFVGRQWGTTKLLPSLSPNKTIAGAWGGLIGSLLAASAMWYLNFRDQSPVLFLLICVIAGIVAQAGDLFESLLKRVADVKDSGHIMPGHGGVLDRIDGVLFAGPLLYIYAFYFTQTRL